MYWRRAEWHFLTRRNLYVADRICYFTLIKRSPFANGHPVLEPELVGVCMASSKEDVDLLAIKFVGIVDEQGIVPDSPFTDADGWEKATKIRDTNS